MPISLVVGSQPASDINHKLEVCMEVGIPMRMGFPWEFYGNGIPMKIQWEWDSYGNSMKMGIAFELLMGWEYE